MTQNHPDPAQYSSRTLKPGADPWPIIQSLLMQIEALSATALLLLGCFQPGTPEPAQHRAPRTFGRRDTPAQSAPTDRPADPTS